MSSSEDGSEYTVESYYEEEIVMVPAARQAPFRPPATVAPRAQASVPSSMTRPQRAAPPVAPASRPGGGHPLFGGAGAKNALAAAAKNMENKRATNPTQDPRPSHSITASSVPSSTSAPISRPFGPHPVFGGGGGGTTAPGGRLSLHDQIKAKAAQRSTRVSQNSAEDAAPALRPKTPVNVARPPAARPVSIADQVASMAAQRQSRQVVTTNERQELENEQPDQDPVAPEPVFEHKHVTSRASNVTTVAQKPATSSFVPSPPPAVQKPVEKKGWLRQEKKVESHPPKKMMTVILPQEKQPPAFQNAQLRSFQSTETPAATTQPQHAFLHTKLMKTGVQLDLAPVQDDHAEVLAQDDAAPEQAKAWRTETPGKAAPPTQTIKRVTKSDPEYEIVEYKCMCVVM